MTSAEQSAGGIAGFPTTSMTGSSAHAESALASLNAAVGRMSNGDAVCDAFLRKEAIAAVAPDGRVRLADLLLFEAASPTHPAHGMCRNVEVELEACQRYLGALAHGYRMVATSRGLTADALMHMLGMLADVPCSKQREIISGTVEDVEGWLGSSKSVQVVVQAAIVQDRLTRLAGIVGECALLGRIAALLILRNESSSPPPIVLSRYTVSPCPEASADPKVIERFCTDVADRSTDALALVDRIAALAADDERRIATLSKAAHSAQRVLHAMLRAPVIALPRLLDDTGLHVQAAMSALHRLRALGIVREVTGRYRHRVYSYDAYIAALEGNATA